MWARRRPLLGESEWRAAEPSLPHVRLSEGVGMGTGGGHLRAAPSDCVCAQRACARRCRREITHACLSACMTAGMCARCNSRLRFHNFRPRNPQLYMFSILYQ